MDLTEAEAAAGFTVTATLAWNRGIADSTFTPTLLNLDLELYSVTNGTFVPAGSLALSNSTVDNVEHVYTSIGGGAVTRYAFKVSGTSFSINQSETYALSWDIVPSAIPEPAHMGLITGLFAAACTVRRRRRAPLCAGN
jgi:hypothetical protein